jgi:glycosyltransferase involved in cell wall biosynthesis
MVSTYHGSTYRQQWPWYNSFDRTMYRLPTALNLDLVMFGPRWLPRPMPDMAERLDLPDNGTFRVAHAPTNRRIKSTEDVIAALDGLRGVELVLIEGVSNAECIKIKAGCHLLLEEFKLGYGTNALENWAMGIPVIGDAFPSIKSYMATRLGELPFVETPVEQLRERVKQLKDDPAAYKAAAEKGRTYWEKYHRPKVVAEMFVNICREAKAATEDLQWQGGPIGEN